MMSTTTELPMHEVILKIMYNANKEKPISLSAGDVLWKIDNPEITERYVKEVLNWLVRERKVQLYLDKYTLDRYEFLEQKAKHSDIEEEAEEVVVLDSAKETFYIKPTKKKTNKQRSKILFFSGLVALCYVTYLFKEMERNYEITTEQIDPNTLVNKQPPVKRLVLSYNEEENLAKKIEDISYLFSRQNTNNKNMQYEIANLYKVTDSLQKQQQHQLNAIQKRLNANLNENVSYMNNFLQKTIYCNIIFLAIITFIFFKS